MDTTDSVPRTEYGWRIASRHGLKPIEVWPNRDGMTTMTREEIETAVKENSNYTMIARDVSPTRVVSVRN